MNTHENNNISAILKPPKKRIFLARQDHPVESSDQLIDKMEKSIADLAATINRIIERKGIKR